ncbi:TIGR04372 family glycosyltransferase [Desulfobacter latus]|uniref:TIGR04372 family glycosyltransferase n=1 Tax=Desulfobacter latus TaxID=2292 RepID=A0A850T7D9_9BACT|nr:TIGR04372 family glycosyltransferase [Desulfobacter latus]NWH04965.1 TIGR04372 family glycosyltransferase [Desulfobacter latus]
MAEIETLYMLLNINRIGHMTMELFFALQPQIENPETTLICHPSNRAPCNMAMYKILQRYYHIKPIDNFDEVANSRSVKSENGKQLRVITFHPPYELFRFYYRWRNNEITPRFYKFTKEEIDTGHKIYEIFKIKDASKIVTLHVREDGYIPQLSYHTYRSADIRTYEKAIDYLIETGHTVVRIGDPSMKKLQPRDNLIDLPFCGYKNDFFDLWFVAESRFMICTSSGPYDMATVFGKTPKLAINSISTGPHFIHRMDRYIPKRMHSEKLKRELRIEEMRFPGVFSGYSSFYEENGIKIVNNSEDEILESTKEMVSDLDNGTPVDQHDEHQLKFASMMYNLHKSKIISGYGEDAWVYGPHISTVYLRRHPHLVDTPYQIEEQLVHTHPTDKNAMQYMIEKDVHLKRCVHHFRSGL